MRLTRVAGFVALLAGAQLAAQPSDSRPGPQFATETPAVVVDVVVRDRSGTHITDLRREDFQLFEDGVLQEIADVTLVNATGGELSSAAASPTSTGSTSAPAPARPGDVALPAQSAGSLTAFVFDRLSPEARTSSYRAALSSLETLQAGDRVGVFVADLSLVTLAWYTHDPARIRRGLDEAVRRATAVAGRREVSSATGDDHPEVSVTAGAESPGRRVGQSGLMSMEGIPGDRWEKLERQWQGYATVNSLMELVAELSSFPGRKNVVFFAEGLALPDAVMPRFQSLVAMANRANVSFYTIDAAGLRVHSKDAETGRAVRGIGRAGISLRPDGSNASNTALMEVNEDVLRRDPRTSLTLLARDTGGFLVDGTNDLAGALRRIDADRRLYYLLTYVPRRTAFDGEWRSVSVKVPSRRADVRARSGYLAVPMPSQVPVFVHEAPALAALSRRPDAADIPVRAAALAFPEGDDSQLAVLVSTPGSGVEYRKDRDGKHHRTDFTILAVIRDADGTIIRKGSEHYQLAVPSTDLEKARSGGVLFFRLPTLAPGSYTLQAAVHDAFTRRVGVRSVAFSVPESSDIQVSSLVLVERGERVGTGGCDSANPLCVGDVQLYPNLGSPIDRAIGAVTLFAKLKVARGTPAQAALEVVDRGRVVRRDPVQLDDPDDAGRVLQLIRVPVATLAPGSYTLRLVIDAAGTATVRQAEMTLR